MIPKVAQFGLRRLREASTPPVRFCPASSPPRPRRRPRRPAAIDAGASPAPLFRGPRRGAGRRSPAPQRRPAASEQRRDGEQRVLAVFVLVPGRPESGVLYKALSGLGAGQGAAVPRRPYPRPRASSQRLARSPRRQPEPASKAACGTCGEPCRSMRRRPGLGRCGVQGGGTVITAETIAGDSAIARLSE